jgi:hypothetical protein
VPLRRERDDGRETLRQSAEIDLGGRQKLVADDGEIDLAPLNELLD